MSNRRRSIRALTVLVAGALLCVGVPQQLHAQQQRTAAEWVVESQAHRIAGYVTLGLAATTAVLGILEADDVHQGFAYATTGASAVTLSLGVIGYGRSWKSVWPHILMNALAVTGYALNAFVLEGGSPGHIATGASSIGLMGAAVLYIALR